MLESGGKITEAVIIDGVRQEMIYWERKREGLEMSVVDNIREIIMLRKYDLRRGYAIFQNTLVEDETQLCQLLCRIFDEEEKEIEKEHQKSFVTDDYEKDIMSFAIDLDHALFLEKTTFLDQNIKMPGKTYKELYARRHMAYAFFHNLDIEKDRGKKHNRSVSGLHETAYPALIEFYGNFIGKFADNEEAIRLICQFYPQKELSGLSVDRTAETLFTHIRHAGTMKDHGYAYHGIEMIKTYIHNVPEAVLGKVLRQYHLYGIINDMVCRHQIHAVITSSSLTGERQRRYKFWYLDSLILADILNKILYKKLQEDTEDVDRAFLADITMDTDPLVVFGSPEGYWKNNQIGEREFYLDNHLAFTISLSKGNVAVSNLSAHVMESFLFDMKDWRLEGYYQRQEEQRLYGVVFGSSGEKINYRQMLFSLLFLNRYHGMEEQQVDFDHRYHYDNQKKELRISQGTEGKIPHFYGKAVSSLSCIVGKNGTGKSSTVDFLRETFLRLIKLVEETDIIIENGYIKKEAYQDYHILGEDTEFLVVFRLDDDAYYVTNIDGITAEQAVHLKPFNRGTIRSFNEISKLFYFSGLLKNDLEPFADTEQRMDVEKGSKQEQAIMLDDFKQYDYSEMGSFLEKITCWKEGIAEDKDYINKELCYQFTFLKYMGQDRMNRLLDLKTDKIFHVRSRMPNHINDAEEQFTLGQIGNDPEQLDWLLEKFVHYPDAKIEYFSSGEYAKFAFLARLYWMLEGCQREKRLYENKWGKNIFGNEESLLLGETAVIFIDEGEVYYHPEWQRCYIDILLKMINENLNQERVQVVITTNSPFILSDVLREDVVYLSGEEEKITEMREKEITFGQNIHRLLRRNFFMEATIGEYAKTMIQEMIGVLQGGKKSKAARMEDIRKFLHQYYTEVKDGEEYEDVQRLIHQVGEPIYRDNLEKLVSIHKAEDKNWQIREMQKEIQQLEERIQRLKHD